MSLGPIQRLMTNPLASALDTVLAYKGPQQLETWIRSHTVMIDEIPDGGLEESVRSHPMLKRIAGKAVRNALAGWNVEWAAETLDVMWSIAPSIAAEQAAPDYQPQLTEALQHMCQRLAEPDAFPWFCDQCAGIAQRIQAVLSDNPGSAS